MPATDPNEFAAAASGTPSPFRNADVSYLHLPAVDARESGEFYRDMFGWKLSGDLDNPSFRDHTGHVTGGWVTHRASAVDRGPIPYMYVDDIEQTVLRLEARGAPIVAPPFPEGDLIVALFQDPGGNAIGIWQHAAPARRG